MTDLATTPDKRTAIFDGMLDLVAEKGFHGTAMSQVAKRSKVSAGIIYHYFDNKDALIHELYREVKMRFAAALLHGNPQDLDYPQDVEQLWRNAYEFYVTHPRETLFLEQYDNSPYHKEWDEEAALESGDENLMTLMNMMGRRINEGHIRQMPYGVMYELTFGVAVGLAKRQISGAIDLDAATLATVAAACRRAIETL